MKLRGRALNKQEVTPGFWQSQGGRGGGWGGEITGKYHTLNKEESLSRGNLPTTRGGQLGLLGRSSAAREGDWKAPWAPCLSLFLCEQQCTDSPDVCPNTDSQR